MTLSGSDIPVRENLRLFRQIPMLPFSYRARANFAARGLDPRLVNAAALSVLAHMEDLVTRGVAIAEGPITVKGRYRRAS